MKTSQIIEKNTVLFNRWASWYDWFPFQFWMRRFYRPLLKEIDFSARPSVLDVSCGTGELLKELHQASEGRMNLFGVDIAEKMVEKARQKLPATIFLETADVHALPFSEGKFDDVISTEAFHHYYDQKRALQELERVIKANGRVVVVDVNFFLPILHRLFEKVEPGCVHINSSEEMRQLFQDAGLEVIRQQRTFLFAVMTVGVKR